MQPEPVQPMHIPSGELEMLRKTGDRDASWSGNSPAIYHVRNNRGGYVVQGFRLDAETLGQLRNLAGHETAVWVPSDVIDGPGE